MRRKGGPKAKPSIKIVRNPRMKSSTSMSSSEDDEDEDEHDDDEDNIYFKTRNLRFFAREIDKVQEKLTKLTVGSVKNVMP